ncbi:MAG: VanZ family protein [Gammaproteobacteria bacterium]|nr:VanZ family protein [Gammaproteobacteria bacterium]
MTKVPFNIGPEYEKEGNNKAMKAYLDSIPFPVLKIVAAGLIVVGLAHLSTLGADGSRAATAFRDAMHAPAFMLLTLGLLLGLSSRLSLVPSYAFAIAVAAMAGITGEAFQAIGPGDASIADLGSDALGIFAGALFFASFDRRIPYNKAPGLRVAIAASALFLAAAIFSPAAKFGLSFNARINALPTIYSPSSDWQATFFDTNYGATALSISCADGWDCAAEGLTKVIFGHQEYSGIRLETAKNWQNYVMLNMPIAAADGYQHRLTLSINDGVYEWGYSDRFNYHFDVPIDATVLQIPVSDIRNAPSSRQMEMDDITNLYLFMDAPAGGEAIVIGRIFLSMQ